MTYVDKNAGTVWGEIQGFTPMEVELVELVKFWARESIEKEFWQWACETYGGFEGRTVRMGWLRVGQIEKLIGEEKVKEAIETVVAKISNEYGTDEYWTTYQAGGARDSLPGAQGPQCDQCGGYMCDHNYSTVIDEQGRRSLVPNQCVEEFSAEVERRRKSGLDFPTPPNRPYNLVQQIGDGGNTTY